jgi:hypothetical protein
MGAKLLALSLEKHCRDFTLFLGVLEENADFSDWLRRHAPHVVLVRLHAFIRGASLKHVKPVLILELFSRGITDVTWLDTDLIVLRNLEPLLEPLDNQTLLVAQDMDYDFQFHEKLLQHYRLTPSRKLEYCVNTCVLRATTQHAALMEKYQAFLLDPFFLEQQGKSESEKLPEFAFEQKILELLVSSEGEEWRPEYTVKFIPEGSGIIQELGVTTYGLRDRLLNGLGFNKPWFAHIPGAVKPWDSNTRSRYYRGASVYSSFAENYKDQMEEDMSWANSSGASSRIARFLYFGKPHWMGWAHCLAGKLWRFLRTGTIRRRA